MQLDRPRERARGSSSRGDITHRSSAARRDRESSSEGTTVRRRSLGRGGGCNSIGRAIVDRRPGGGTTCRSVGRAIVCRRSVFIYIWAAPATAAVQPMRFRLAATERLSDRRLGAWRVALSKSRPPRLHNSQLASDILHLPFAVDDVAVGVSDGLVAGFIHDRVHRRTYVCCSSSASATSEGSSCSCRADDSSSDTCTCTASRCNADTWSSSADSCSCTAHSCRASNCSADSCSRSDSCSCRARSCSCRATDDYSAAKAGSVVHCRGSPQGPEISYSHGLPRAEEQFGIKTRGSFRPEFAVL